MHEMNRWLLATNNPHKVREIQAILGRIGISLLVPHDIDLTLEVPEPGRYCAANAVIKARAFSKASGMIALADDSGVFVDALGGLPGVDAAYFGGPRATDDDNRKAMADALVGANVTEDKPSLAHYLCCLAVAFPSSSAFLPNPQSVASPLLIQAPGQYVLEGDGTEVLVVAERLDGHIAPACRGTNGFSYDPQFTPLGQDLRLAEMADDVKNTLSHRRKALDSLIRVIEARFLEAPGPVVYGADVDRN